MNETIYELQIHWLTSACDKNNLYMLCVHKYTVFIITDTVSVILCKFHLDNTLMLTTIESSCLSHKCNETNSAVVMLSTDSMAMTTTTDSNVLEDPQDTQIHDDQVMPSELEPSE
jgi:hypothetical protein